MAKVHDFLEMWQGSQNLRATQKECRAHNTQMTSRGYISDTEEIVKASWSHCQHDGAAAFSLSEKSPVPPALCAKDLHGGRTQVLDVRPIKRIDCHPARSEEACSPESISATQNWLNWIGDLDNPNDSEHDWEAENESDMELDNSSEDSETPEQWNVCAAQNIPALIGPITRSKEMAETRLMMVNIMETRRDQGIKKT